MARQLKVRRPNAAEMRQLCQILEESTQTRLCRWAEVLLFYGASLSATSIAEALAVHVNTIYLCLQRFARQGMSLFECVSPQGAPPRSSVTQLDEIAQRCNDLIRTKLFTDEIFHVSRHTIQLFRRFDNLQ